MFHWFSTWKARGVVGVAARREEVGMIVATARRDDRAARLTVDLMDGMFELLIFMSEMDFLKMHFDDQWILAAEVLALAS
jgi:hypothetical protein